MIVCRGVWLFLPPIREIVADEVVFVPVTSSTKVLVYLLRIQVIAAFCYLLANLEDLLVVLFLNVRLLGLNERLFLNTIFNKLL